MPAREIIEVIEHNLLEILWNTQTLKDDPVYVCHVVDLTSSLLGKGPTLEEAVLDWLSKYGEED